MKLRIPIAIYLVIITLCNIIPKTFQDLTDNEVDDASPLNEIANLLQSKDSLNLLNNLMQSEGGQQLGGMLMDTLSKNSDAIAGLGSLLTNNQGNVDADMLNNVIDMFTDNASSGSPTSSKDAKQKKVNDEPTFGGLLKDIASDFLGGSRKALSLMSYIPLLTKTLTSFTDEDVRAHEYEHSGHAWFLPPIIEKLHIYWDHLMHSELGRQLYKNFGIEQILKHFQDKDGKFNFDRVVELVENHSFRRYWIKKATGGLESLIAYFADPLVQKKYFANVQYLLNGFLKARGYPRQALFDSNRPAESITSFCNYFIKKYFTIKTNVGPYVQPIVHYIEELVSLAQEQSRALKLGIIQHSISDKLTDTINLELIEPVLRVFRAYRYAKRVPKCDKYIMCLINQEEQNKDISLPNVKLVLSKVSSLFASWFLTYHTNSSYWSLYNAITDMSNKCQESYPVDCSDYHAEEIKVTTEYFHNEL